MIYFPVTWAFPGLQVNFSSWLCHLPKFPQLLELAVAPALIKPLCFSWISIFFNFNFFFNFLLATSNGEMKSLPPEGLTLSLLLWVWLDCHQVFQQADSAIGRFWVQLGFKNKIGLKLYLGKDKAVDFKCERIWLFLSLESEGKMRYGSSF